MRRDEKFEDRSPGNVIYQGDLKYGRALGTEVKKQKDYRADYNEDGIATNQPIMPLPSVFKRDEFVWKGKYKHPKGVKVVNPPGLADELLVKGMENRRGLLAQVSSFYSGNRRVF